MSRAFTKPKYRPGPLPAQQAVVLAFVVDELAAARPFPSFRAIADHVGWTKEGSARDCLLRLVWRGRLVQIANNRFALADAMQRTNEGLERATAIINQMAGE
ncbi:hypothetical protein [Hyphomicrobium sp.]|uniref:hypothetical protein n=1 Tax=Hyphomicrobium sp. TaxID=82 RepID=UPI001D6A15C9|nr:hypothetical protein [Hyphomicrobium sp.]MBY0559935.1 hypothetical protein [Hyphomicrobium sp.]